MKKGFLKTKKAIRATEEAVDAEEQKKKESERHSEGDTTETENNPKDDGIVDPDDPEENLEKINLHEIPDYIRQQLAGRSDDRKRVVFRAWPRDPKGQVMEPNHPDSEGKQTSNGIKLWGATLYDFYHVRPIPSCRYLERISTGSRLAAQMRKFGELDFARSEIDWADREDNPRQVYPCDISVLIRDAEYFDKIGMFGNMMTGYGKHIVELGVNLEVPAPLTPKPKEQGGKKKAAKGKEKEKVEEEPSTPQNNPFIGRPPVLQQRLPYHLLPQKLIVHDPWNLCIQDDNHYYDEERSYEEAPFTARPDIVREYKLELTNAGKEKVKQSLQDCEKEADEWVIFDPKEEVAKPIDRCLIAAKVPPRPKRPESVPEAHLYLSPAHSLGRGNHSFVYKAVWELPRWVLVPDDSDVFCDKCFIEAVQREAEAKFEAGEVVKAEDQKEAAWVEYAEGKAYPRDRQVYKSDAPVTPLLEGTDIAEKVHAVGMIAEDAPLPVKILKYDGPKIEVYPDVKWQNPKHGPLCAHLESVQHDKQAYDTPATARVQVAAKLSIKGDPHLAVETSNYQSFPDHFFEHWNGYNLIRPLHDPVPVGAVCPQYYGYYVPAQAATKGKKKQAAAEPESLSPIMLIEHCGRPLEVDKLSRDDRQECASLLLKFHDAGYVHNSFKEANIVVQDGPLSAWPLGRMAMKLGHNPVKSFRLIDFSRASLKAPDSDYMSERELCLSLFKLMHYSHGAMLDI